MRSEKSKSMVNASKGIVVSPPVGILFLTPLLGLIGVFFFGALISLVIEIFGDGFVAAVAIFEEVLSKSLFQTVAIRTLRISFSVTIITVIVGYLAAYAIWRSPKHHQMFWLSLILFPLFTSVVVRTYAWSVIMSRGGVINTLLEYLGIISEPIRMLGTEGAVLIGLVQVMLPFAILPIYTLLLRIDEDLLRASAICGAPVWITLWRVVLPLTKQGTVVASILVFVISLGFFITPAILGGPRFSMVSNLISTQVTMFSDVKEAAAMSLIMLALTFALLMCAAFVGSISDHFRSSN